MRKQQAGQRVGLEQNMLGVTIFVAEVVLFAFIEAMMDDGMALERLFGETRLVHEILVPVPLEETAIDYPAKARKGPVLTANSR